MIEAHKKRTAADVSSTAVLCLVFYAVMLLAATYRLDGNRLILSKANGESMVFERTGKASSLE